MAKEKILRFLICGTLAGIVYFIFFQTPIVSKWGMMPGPSFGEIDGQTWLALHLKWLTFNKFAGYYWVALFMACAFGILSDDASESVKWGPEEIEYRDSEITAGVYKYANNDSNLNMLNKKKYRNSSSFCNR